MRRDEDSRLLKTLADLGQLLGDPEQDFQGWVVPRLAKGHVWWIPDSDMAFGGKTRHPGVVIGEYAPGQVRALVCPRTTSFTAADGHLGVITPAHLLAGLDEAGLILLQWSYQRAILARAFARFNYIGKLPEDWIGKIAAFLDAQLEGMSE